MLRLPLLALLTLVRQRHRTPAPSLHPTVMVRWLAAVPPAAPLPPRGGAAMAGCEATPAGANSRSAPSRGDLTLFARQTWWGALTRFWCAIVSAGPLRRCHCLLLRRPPPTACNFRRRGWKQVIEEGCGGADGDAHRRCSRRGGASELGAVGRAAREDGRYRA
jgi:hypothetical protein